MRNDFIPMLVNIARSGGNPTQMLQRMANSDPQIAQAYRMIQGKNPQQLQQMAMNMCRERGTTPEEILKQLNLK